MAWLETDVLGFYEHEFRLDRGAQRIEGTWRYIRELWRRDWWPTSDMADTVEFLSVRCSDRVDPPMFFMDCMDERFRAPCLRLLASALREFPWTAVQKATDGTWVCAASRPGRAGTYDRYTGGAG